MGIGACGGSLPLTNPNHCCWINGEPCFALQDSGAELACSLMAELGDWGVVHADPRYREFVHPVLDSQDIVPCGDWPAPGDTCKACGLAGKSPPTMVRS